MPSPLCLVASFLLAAAAPPTDTSTAERHLCECAGVPTDADGLLLWLRLRTPGDAAAADVERLVSQLGDDAFAVRTAAFDRLKRLGALAVPALRKRAKDADLEVRRGVERLLALPGAKATESSRPFASVERAAVKLLAARPREETAAVLLAYLPHAESEEAHDEVYATLDVLREAGLGLMAMRTALTDASPVRRAAAGCVLARRGEARELLRDKDALVRLRTAQGMLSADAPDAKSLPTLIDLVGHESRAVSWQAEELLRYAAGPTSPKALVGGHTPGERKACEAAWRGWWKATGATIDLRGLHTSGRAPGLTLMVAGMPDAKVADRVYLHVIGGDGESRYRRELLSGRGFWYAYARPSGEVVVASTSRDEKKSRAFLTRFAADGTRLFDREVPEMDRWHGGVRLLADGRCLVWWDGYSAELDAAGKELKPLLRAKDAEQGGFVPGPDGFLYGWSGRFGDFSPRGRMENTGEDCERAAAEYYCFEWPRRTREGKSIPGPVLDAHLADQHAFLGDGSLFAVAPDKGWHAFLTEFTPAGRVVRRFGDQGVAFARLADGGVLAFTDRLVEYGPTGRVRWDSFVGLSPDGKTPSGWMPSAAVLHPLSRFGFRRATPMEAVSRDTLQGLFAATGDPRPEARRWAMNRIRSRYPRLDSHVRELMTLTEHADPIVAEIAAECLCRRTGETTPEVVAHVLKLMRQGKGHLWFAYPLVYGGDGCVGELLAMLKARPKPKGKWDELHFVTRQSLLYQAVVNGNAEAIKSVPGQWGEDEDDAVLFCWNVKYAARERLREREQACRPPAGPAEFDFLAPWVPKLLRLAGGKNQSVKWTARESLAALRRTGAPMIPLLLPELKVAAHRTEVLRMLAAVGAGDPEIDALLPTFIDAKYDADTVCAALKAVAGRKPSKETLAAVAKFLDVPESKTGRCPRYAAREAIASFGRDAAAFAPRYLAIAADEKQTGSERHWAFYIVGRIGRKEDMVPLVRAYHNAGESDDMRRFILRAIAGTGADGFDVALGIARDERGPTPPRDFRTVAERDAWLKNLVTCAWEEVGDAADRDPAAARRLRAVAADAKEKEAVRAGAIFALIRVKGREFTTLLAGIAADAKEPRAVREAAMKALPQRGRFGRDTIRGLAAKSGEEWMRKSEKESRSYAYDGDREPAERRFGP